MYQCLYWQEEDLILTLKEGRKNRKKNTNWRRKNTNWTIVLNIWLFFLLMYYQLICLKVWRKMRTEQKFMEILVYKVRKLNFVRFETGMSFSWHTFLTFLTFISLETFGLSTNSKKKKDFFHVVFDCANTPMITIFCNSF